MKPARPSCCESQLTAHMCVGVCSSSLLSLFGVGREGMRGRGRGRGRGRRRRGGGFMGSVSWTHSRVTESDGSVGSTSDLFV